MDTLFEKLSQLSSPLGSLLDAALNRLAPHTTASACGGGLVFCYVTCTGHCRSVGFLLKTLVYAPSDADCDNNTHLTRCGGVGCC